MGRVVILMGLVSVVAVVYALMPAEYEPPPESAAKVASEAPAPEAEKAPPAPPKKAELPRVKPMPRPALKTPSKADDALAVGDDEEALTEEEKAIFKPLPPPPLEAPKQTVFPTAPQPAWTKKHGRDPATPMPVLSIQPIKRSVRAFYGNLPKGGRMPARIEIQEVLPLSVIEAINVPPESQLTMLGPFDTSVPSGLTEILNISEQHEGIFGVSVITPNGEKHREYIKTKP